MLKYLTFIAPLLLKAPRKNPVQTMVLFAVMGLLLAVAGMAILIGIWQFIFALFDANYLAWTVIGILLLLGAGAIYFFLLKAPEKPRADLSPQLETDPLTELLPDQLTQDPAFAKALRSIADHPFGAVITAVLAGTLLGHEVLSGKGGGKRVYFEPAE